jgi:photosystem II stability/assembly factor-like uncharacterized protein
MSRGLLRARGERMLVCLCVSLASACAAAGGSASSTTPQKRESPPAAATPAAPSAQEPVPALPPGLERVGSLPASRNSCIQCSDETTCWLNERGRLWQTLDGGRSWSLVFDAADRVSNESYQLINAREGWRLSIDGLYRTSDGGKTWAQSPSPLAPPNGEIKSFWFSADGHVGWLAGGMYRPLTAEEKRGGFPNRLTDANGERVLEQALFRSDDGGESWRRQPLPVERFGSLLGINFLDAAHGVVVGDRDFYRTQDGGDRWERPTLKRGCVRAEYMGDGYEAQLIDIEMLDAGRWWGTYSDGRIIKSLNGGKTWCDLLPPGGVEFDTPSRQFFVTLHFVDAEHGWGWGSDRLLYETRDGGATWHRVTEELRFDCMYFLNREQGFLVSDKGLFRLTGAAGR